MQTAVSDLRDALVAQGGTTLGDLIGKGAVVCLEQSIILHAVLNENKTFPNRLVITDFGDGTGHAWVEYKDRYKRQDMVADAVWGFNLPVAQAMEKYGHPRVMFRQTMGKGTEYTR